MYRIRWRILLPCSLQAILVLGYILFVFFPKPHPSASKLLQQRDNGQCLPGTNYTFPPFDETQAMIYRYRQQQAVNLGSWFVHEVWMTPSVFRDAAGNKSSELDIANGSGSTDIAQKVLERHWATFITQDDFNYLANIGINTVRLPVGYWSLGSSFCQGTPYERVASAYQNSWMAVMRAISMANQAGIGVIVDLHGAVGSQNGQPHSGISDGQTGLFANQDAQDKTIQVLNCLMQQLGDINNIVGIELLNEPQLNSGLNGFYNSALESMRQSSPRAADFPLYLHDAFQLNSLDDILLHRNDFLVLDHHSYFAFSSDDSSRSASDNTQSVRVATKVSLDQISQTRSLVIGEWSCALTNESLSRDATNIEQDRKTFCGAQMETYSNTSAGWSFWSYVMEDCNNHPDWCFRAAVGNSLPSTFFPYGTSSFTEFSEVACNITVPNAPSLVPRHLESDNPGGSKEKEIRSDSDLMDRCWVTGYQAAKTFQSSPYKSKIGFLNQFFDDRFASGLSDISTKSGCRDRFRDGVHAVEGCIEQLNKGST